MTTNNQSTGRQAKTVHINVRMTKAQRRDIGRRAAGAGMAPSSFMREAALLAGEKPERVADADELRRIHVDLKRIGNNLNQAVRAMNTYGVDPISVGQVAQAAGKVSQATSRLAALLARARR